jgi:outer membrane receptor protein involved in Fe transport
VTITAGASFDYLKGDPAFIPGGDEALFNPKFGITWNPFPTTTVRAAAFRVLKRTLITDQTLEPTQVAGFNQFFDDPNVTEAWRYGAAIDQKLTKDLFGGLEFSWRDLEIPLVTNRPGSAPFTQKFDGKEYLSNAYLFWTPHQWVALRAGYMFERFQNELSGLPKNLDTHRVPLGISFFHSSGISALLTGTYYNQSGTFPGFPTGPERSGREDFWLVDAAINYRLPKRYGFITVGVTNLFDRKFKYFEPDLNNPHIQPDRVAFFKVTLALP